MSDEEMNAKLQEINNRHLQKLSENWDIQQPVQFSLLELNLLRSAVVNEHSRYFKAFHHEDADMRALMRKIDKIMEDIEVQIRDGQTTATSDCDEPGRTHCMSWDESASEQEESEQPNGETFNNVHDFNDGIFDPAYINDIVDCSDMGIYPWGNS